jgi:transposase
MLHSGIDLHKRTVVISTVDPSGHPVRDAELQTSRARIQSYFAGLPCPHRAVVESTSNWYWLRDLLLSSGVDLRLGHSKYIKAISYAKVKTDAVDAATLAQLLRSDLIPEAHMVSPEWREARDLLRARCRELRREEQAQADEGRESLLEDKPSATPR